MNNNDYLRSLRYALRLKEEDIQRIASLAGHSLTHDTIKAMLVSEEAEGHILCSDLDFERILDGLIIDRRGPSPGPASPKVPATLLSNNDILKKIRIALKLSEEDMIAILKRGGFTMTKGELGALFRNPGHRNYKPCGDQVVRYFLRGLADYPAILKEE